MTSEFYDLNEAVFEPYLKELKTKKRKREELEERGPRTCYERRDIVAETSGRLIYNKCRNLFFDGFDLMWSTPQRKCFMAALNSMLPRIFGDEWVINQARILSDLGIKFRKDEVLISMARRNGKSYATAAIAVCALLTIPGISIAIFSISDRQSKQMLRDIKALWRKACECGRIIKESEYSIITDSVKVFEIKTLATGTRQNVTAYPGSSKVNLFHSSFPLLIKYQNEWEIPHLVLVSKNMKSQMFLKLLCMKKLTS